MKSYKLILIVIFSIIFSTIKSFAGFTHEMSLFISKEMVLYTYSTIDGYTVFINCNSEKDFEYNLNQLSQDIRDLEKKGIESNHINHFDVVFEKVKNDHTEEINKLLALFAQLELEHVSLKIRMVFSGDGASNSNTEKIESSYMYEYVQGLMAFSS